MFMPYFEELSMMKVMVRVPIRGLVSVRTLDSTRLVLVGWSRGKNA